MQEYGYSYDGMLPVTRERALELDAAGLTVYVLHEDNTESKMCIRDRNTALQKNCLIIGRMNGRLKMMRYKLVIAEKPSVAQSLAAVIGATARKDGYLEGNGWRVSWCVGHLAGLADADS